MFLWDELQAHISSDSIRVVGTFIHNLISRHLCLKQTTQNSVPPAPVSMSAYLYTCVIYQRQAKSNGCYHRIPGEIISHFDVRQSSETPILTISVVL